MKRQKKGATFVRKATIGETFKTFDNSDLCIGASTSPKIFGKAVYLDFCMVKSLVVPSYVPA
jgi:hypothetical protein